MKKLIASILIIALVCIAVSSCGGSCNSGNDGAVSSTESSTAASTPAESPTETPAKTEESTAPESTLPETTLPETHLNVHYHDYNEIWLTDEDGHWHKCKLCICVTEKEPHELDVAKVLMEPTEKTAGQAIFTCKTCQYSFVGELPYAPEESK